MYCDVLVEKFKDYDLKTEEVCCLNCKSNQDCVRIGSGRFDFCMYCNRFDLDPELLKKNREADADV